MKKKLLIMTAIASGALLLFANPAFAARIVTGTYSFPAVGTGDAGGFCLGPNSGTPLDSCVQADPIAGEHHVDVSVTGNANGTGLENPVEATVGQDLNGDGSIDTGANFCGSITNFAIDDVGVGGAAVPVLVFPWPGPAVLNTFPTVSVCTGSLATSGTVTFSFNA